MEKTVERALSGKVSEDIIEDVAYGLVQQYGDAAASVACEFYDTLAANAGVNVPDAEAAEPAGYDDVRNVVQSRPVTESPGAVGRFVKQAAEETMLQNCKRDHGEFAWAPSPGTKCAFCITVASNGWRRIRSSDHAEHLHHNCKCEYVVRFDETTEVDGYDPDRLFDIYDNMAGEKPEDKIRSLQRLLNGKNSLTLEQIDFIIGLEKDSSILGTKTPGEWKTFFENLGFDIEPLGKGSLKGIKYEDGGGYRIHYRGDGYLQYHPAGAHHIEAYYKRSSAKDGVRRYKLDGSEKDD